MNVEKAAKICHEANKAYCETIGDNSQPTWDEAPDWQKNSAIEGVRFTVYNPNKPASASHESWLALKEKEGWKYGPVKDPEKKEHPCFVPYDELPTEQKIKDHIFQGIVKSLIPFLNEGVASGETK